MQIVYISNRIPEMADTVRHMRRYMPFVNDILVFCPPRMMADFHANLPGARIVDERELLERDPTLFTELKQDHQANHDKINYLLRKGLASHKLVADEFIMSDDDFRPIRTVEKSFFKPANGIYNAYFMTSIEHYVGFISQKADINPRNVPFHNAHRDMLHILKSVGLPSLMYAVHMPQIINKRILAESTKYFDRWSDRYRFDEWSTYFNFATFNYPDRFRTKLYETMCWPHLNFALCVPDKYTFELIYQDDTIKSPYDTGQIFEGIPKYFREDQDTINQEKISRYGRRQLRYHTGVTTYRGLDIRAVDGMTRSAEGLVCSGNPGTCASFGPYATLPAGDYIARIRFAANYVKSDNFFHIDICGNAGEEMIVESTAVDRKGVTQVGGGKHEVDVPFSLSQLYTDIEIRTYIAESGNMYTLESIEILKHHNVPADVPRPGGIAKVTSGILGLGRKFRPPARAPKAPVQPKLPADLAQTPEGGRGVRSGKGMRLSLVVATYNVELYIDRFLDSIFSQSSDLDRFEVILVDDGSTDGTAGIIKSWQDRHPEHIRYVYQENAGAAAARNTGLELATGTWVGFPDPDDFLSHDYFSSMLEEAEANHKLPPLAIVSHLIFYHEDRDAYSDTHPLSYRFRKDKVRLRSGDLRNFMQFSVACAWLHRPTLMEKGIRFDLKVRPSFEDSHMVNRLFVSAPHRTVSFLPGPVYYYRKRSNQTSQLDNARFTSRWFIDQLEFGSLDLLYFTRDRLGSIPLHVQRTSLYEIFWRFRHLVDHPERSDFVTPGERARFLELLSEIFSFIQSETINEFDLAGCSEEHKVSLLYLYKGLRRETHSVYLEQIDQAAGMAQFYYFTGGEDDFSVAVEVNGQPATALLPSQRIAEFMGQTYHRRRYFWVAMQDGDDIRFLVDGAACKVKRQGRVLGESAGWLDLRKALAPATPQTADPEIRRLREHVIAARETFRDCQVLMDRDDKADDNAEHLYRHMLNTGRADNAWFVLRRDSLDWDRLAAEGFKLLEFGSDDHIAAQMNAATLLSSHADHHVLWPVEKRYFADLARYKYVFLQHGVTTNDLSNWLNAKPIRLFITAMPDEAHSIADPQGKYVFSEREVLHSGFPRHDALLAKAAQVRPDAILIMPTWRKYLTEETTQDGMRRTKVDDFLASDFARNWQAVLQNPRLRSLAEAHGLKVIFAPHPNMAMYLPDLQVPDWIEQIDVRQGVSYQSLFARAAVAVTDYSSAAFEIAFLQRPVINFQFDFDSVFAGGHICRPGYFSYKDDGFGPVAETPDAFLQALEATLEGREDPVYAERRANAFPFRDGGCCERVCQAVERLAQRPAYLPAVFASTPGVITPPAAMQDGVDRYAYG
jgi:glycosyltransferase involved in cell wall biosynthesis